MEVGNFNAKITGKYGQKLINGKTAASVHFIVSFSDTEKVSMVWVGWTHTEPGKKQALKTMEVMGLEENNYALFELGYGLNTDKEYSVKIVDDIKDDGRVFKRIAFVNEIGSGGKFEILKGEEAVEASKKTGISSDIDRMKAQQRVKEIEASKASITTQEIPF